MKNLEPRGDILLLLDEQGNAFARYDYDPYGNITRTQVTTTTLLPNLSFNTTLAQTQPLRYASYFYDTQTNFYYLSQRYYDPETYQFTSKDPAKADGEESSYQYCGGEPVNKVDPSGEHSTFVRHRHTWYGWISRTYWIFVRFLKSCHQGGLFKELKGWQYIGVKEHLIIALKGFRGAIGWIAKRHLVSSLAYSYTSFAITTFFGSLIMTNKGYAVYRVYWRATVKVRPVYLWGLRKCH